MRSPSATSTFLRTALAAGVLFFLLIIFPQSVLGLAVTTDGAGKAFGLGEVVIVQGQLPDDRDILIVIDDYTEDSFFTIESEYKGARIVLEKARQWVIVTWEQIQGGFKQIFFLLQNENTNESLTNPHVLQKNIPSFLISDVLTSPYCVTSLARFQPILFSLLFVFSLLKIPVTALCTAGLGPRCLGSCTGVALKPEESPVF